MAWGGQAPIMGKIFHYSGRIIVHNTPILIITKTSWDVGTFRHIHVHVSFFVCLFVCSFFCSLICFFVHSFVCFYILKGHCSYHRFSWGFAVFLLVFSMFLLGIFCLKGMPFSSNPNLNFFGRLL